MQRGTPGKKNLHGTRTNAKADTGLHSKLCLKENCVIAVQGNKCTLVFKKGMSLGKSPQQISELWAANKILLDDSFEEK